MFTTIAEINNHITITSTTHVGCLGVNYVPFSDPKETGQTADAATNYDYFGNVTTRYYFEVTDNIITGDRIAYTKMHMDYW